LILLLGVVSVVIAYPRETTPQASWVPVLAPPSEQNPCEVAAPPKPPIEEDGADQVSSAERRYHSHILAASRRHRVDPALVKAVILAESRYDPKAVSPKGAVGLMQLMPSTALSLGAKDSFDPVHNINAGVKYLGELITYFNGNLAMALAAYNAGVGRVERSNKIPRATQRFVGKVLDSYHYYRSKMAQEAAAPDPSHASPQT